MKSLGLWLARHPRVVGLDRKGTPSQCSTRGVKAQRWMVSMGSQCDPIEHHEFAAPFPLAPQSPWPLTRAARAASRKGDVLCTSASGGGPGRRVKTRGRAQSRVQGARYQTHFALITITTWSWSMVQTLMTCLVPPLCAGRAGDEGGGYRPGWGLCQLRGGALLEPSERVRGGHTLPGRADGAGRAHHHSTPRRV
jgi:hypothetical protein